MIPSQESEPTAAQYSHPGENPSAAILEQLRRIQESHEFCNSPRSKEFLSYVVEHGLEGHNELLKERLIGVNLFHRSPTYVTSDDPIVRVKAAEVRRRLAQYYAEEEHAHEVQIEIPVGSYIPKFGWKHSTPSSLLGPAETPAVEEHVPQPKRRAWKIWVAAAALVIVGVAVTITIRRHAQQKSPLEEFWAPVFTTSQPVLICMPSPVSYALNDDVYKRAGKTHPGLYDSQVDRADKPIELDPNTSLKMKDLTPLVDYYVNMDDAYVATDLAGLFARIHKGSQVRVGRDFTYEDLRHSPAVLIGAFNNSWTMRVGAELPFVFREQDGAIAERSGQGRVWRMEADKHHGRKDFAIVARLLNSKTGQFLVVVGGIGMVGTQAAGTFISQPGDLDAALQKAPPGWQGKDLEMVIETDVIDAGALRWSRLFGQFLLFPKWKFLFLFQAAIASGRRLKYT
jgi:hypothetical protein